MIGTRCDELIHCILYAMYAGTPCAALERAVAIHPNVAELQPTMLKQLQPLVWALTTPFIVQHGCTQNAKVGDAGSGEL